MSDTLHAFPDESAALFAIIVRKAPDLGRRLRKDLPAPLLRRVLKWVSAEANRQPMIVPVGPFAARHWEGRHLPVSEIGEDDPLKRIVLHNGKPAWATNDGQDGKEAA